MTAGTTIRGLLFSRGPAAIGRLVVAIGVYAVNRVMRRPGAHISKEAAERLAPAITHSDAAPAIAGIIGRGEPIAPPQHRGPASELPRHRAAAGRPVTAMQDAGSFAKGLVPEAPAGTCRAADKVAGDHAMLSAARTGTEPSNTTSHICCALNDGEAPELTTGERVEAPHAAHFNPSAGRGDS